MGSQLNDWDKALIEKHLPAYKNLEARIREPSSPDERHFVAVFVNGNEPIKTQHEIAYSRYKHLEEQRSRNDQSGLPVAPHTPSKKAPKIPRYLEKRVDTLDAIVIETTTNEETREFASKMADFWKKRRSLEDEEIANVLGWFNYLNESVLSKSLERLSAEKFNTLSNEITKALDGSFAEGLKSGVDYLSPTLHRLIEAGHTLPEAFKKGIAARDNDGLIEELWGTTEALFSDMSSVIGLPLLNISKENANQMLEWLKPLGIDEKKFADLFSYNTLELVGSVIPALAVMFSWNTNDTKKFTELVGTLSIATLYAGNPFGMIIALVGLARSYHRAKIGEVSTKDWIKALSKGGIISSAVLVSMSFVGPTVWAGMVSTIVIAKIMSLHGFHVNWTKLASLIKRQFKPRTEDQ